MVKLTKKVYDDILNTIGNAPIESGGIIGIKDDIICAYYFDKDNYNPDFYAPNVTKLDKVIKQWAQEGITFCGIIHSHANNVQVLSNEDIKFAEEIHEQMLENPIYFPLVVIDKEPKIIFYRYNKIWKKTDYIIKWDLNRSLFLNFYKYLTTSFKMLFCIFS